MDSIGRKKHRSWVNQIPDNLYFSSEHPTENFISLTIVEYEAMRLKHYIGLNQKGAAEKMGISQPTFSRILESAHRKNILALIQGKSIKIYGGNFEVKAKFVGYACIDCKHEWEDGKASKDRRYNCIKCNSKDTYFLIRELI